MMQILKNIIYYILNNLNNILCFIILLYSFLLFFSFFIKNINKKFKHHIKNQTYYIISFCIIFIIKKYFFAIYYVPTSSLFPTVYPNDIILSNQIYFYKKNIHRGDIIIFHWPLNYNLLFMKRVIGIPGDHISYINKKLYINNKICMQKVIFKNSKITFSIENLGNISHYIYLINKIHNHDMYNIYIKKDCYFVMGDNRDNSDDSRYWGMVNINEISGKMLYKIININDIWILKRFF